MKPLTIVVYDSLGIKARVARTNFEEKDLEKSELSFSPFCRLNRVDVQLSSFDPMSK